ncbi:uncharacterized protein MONBRDRAFT_27900 [Monosiga brevicollis MX1]|uniref:Protein kinase domain-containing protein n=1 Tax=Monosiga brevicollis TaxID=81824 RepID=A9V6T1_MONBE|nr:uncharacterized protein MONBRDRAFT_27900 [Monosiga brevicollis MX1]EDQ86860.1 predicted protein [Monosiga brevicollis MX1]|eukprot:XP_001748405.1 hypothetical protein [Monosiga brevicollis MX1]
MLQSPRKAGAVEPRLSGAVFLSVLAICLVSRVSPAGAADASIYTDLMDLNIVNWRCLTIGSSTTGCFETDDDRLVAINLKTSLSFYGITSPVFVPETEADHVYFGLNGAGLAQALASHSVETLTVAIQAASQPPETLPNGVSDCSLVTDLRVGQVDYDLVLSCSLDHTAGNQETGYIAVILWSPDSSSLTVTDFVVVEPRCGTVLQGELRLPVTFAGMTPVDPACISGSAEEVVITSDQFLDEITCNITGDWTVDAAGLCAAILTTKSPTTQPGGQTTSPSQAGSSGSGGDTGAVVGAIVGALAGVALILLLGLFLFRRRQDKQRALAGLGATGGHSLRALRSSQKQIRGNNGYHASTYVRKQFQATDTALYQASLTFASDDPTHYSDAGEIVALLTRSEATELATQSVQLRDCIGAGEFGEVYVATATFADGSKLDCAVKTLRAGSDQKDKLDFLKEAAIMAQFNHPNVLGLTAYVVDQSPNMILTELMSNGSLLGYLSDQPDLPSDDLLLQMALDIALGMQYLSRKGFVHRDLAARNILVNHDLKCSVADFGLSKEIDDGEYFRADAGKIPIRWTAPEAVAERKYTTSSDVWSFGVVLSEIWGKGARPYGNKSNLEVVQSIERGERMPKPPRCPWPVYDVMLKCWKYARRERPSFERLVDVMANFLQQLEAHEPLQVVKWEELAASTSSPRLSQDAGGYLAPTRNDGLANYDVATAGDVGPVSPVTTTSNYDNDTLLTQPAFSSPATGPVMGDYSNPQVLSLNENPTFGHAYEYNQSNAMGLTDTYDQPNAGGLDPSSSGDFEAYMTPESGAQSGRAGMPPSSFQGHMHVVVDDEFRGFSDGGDFAAYTTDANA